MPEMRPLNMLGILLAGGQSARMGRDKARLELAGQPLWLHMREVMLAAGCTRVVVSGPATLAEDAPELADDIVTDITPGLGPLAGLASVLARDEIAKDGNALLVIPVDLPLLTTDTLQALVSALAGSNSSAGSGVNPGVCFDDNALPALLRCTPELRATVTRLLTSEKRRDHSYIALHAALGSRALPLTASAAAALTNTNTPEEWAAAQRP